MHVHVFVFAKLKSRLSRDAAVMLSYMYLSYCTTDLHLWFSTIMRKSDRLVTRLSPVQGYGAFLIEMHTVIILT